MGSPTPARRRRTGAAVLPLRTVRAKTAKRSSLAKVASGIRGLDEITGGGLPRGRPTLICGGAGCGKTLFALEFLVRGASEHGEPGVLVSFEETEQEIGANVASLGFDLQRLVAQKKLFVDWIRVERSEIEETGEYNLEALFVRLQYAIDQVGAKRIALDIFLDHRVNEQVSTRRLRVIKYRGSLHGTNEYPFLIDDREIPVLPITSLGMSTPSRASG